MAYFTYRNAGTVLLVGALLPLLGACRCCPKPPIPLRDQVVMRGTVDRRVDCGPATSTALAVTPASTIVRGDKALRAYPGNEGAFMWVKPGLDLRVFDQLMIDPVQIVPSPGSAIADMTPELKKRATDAVHAIMRDAVAPYYDVVDTPGEFVLRVRLTITDLVASGDAVEGDPAGTVGAAALEGELVDGRTGESLLLFVDRIEGSSRGTVAESEWRAAEGAFHEWADALLDFLDHWEERTAQ